MQKTKISSLDTWGYIVTMLSKETEGKGSFGEAIQRQKITMTIMYSIENVFNLIIEVVGNTKALDGVN